MRAYQGKSIGVLPPHLYAMADRAFRSMKVDNFSKTPYSDATQVS